METREIVISWGGRALRVLKTRLWTGGMKLCNKRTKSCRRRERRTTWKNITSSYVSLSICQLQGTGERIYIRIELSGNRNFCFGFHRSRVSLFSLLLLATLINCVENVILLLFSEKNNFSPLSSSSPPCFSTNYRGEGFNLLNFDYKHFPLYLIHQCVLVNFWNLNI